MPSDGQPRGLADERHAHAPSVEAGEVAGDPDDLGKAHDARPERHAAQRPGRRPRRDQEGAPDRDHEGALRDGRDGLVAQVLGGAEEHAGEADQVLSQQVGARRRDGEQREPVVVEQDRRQERAQDADGREHPAQDQDVGQVADRLARPGRHFAERQVGRPHVGDHQDHGRQRQRRLHRPVGFHPEQARAGRHDEQDPERLDQDAAPAQPRDVADHPLLRDRWRPVGGGRGAGGFRHVGGRGRGVHCESKLRLGASALRTWRDLPTVLPPSRCPLPCLLVSSSSGLASDRTT